MNKNAQQLIEDIDNLVSLPGVFVRINQMVDDPAYSMQQIAEVISQDPGLTVRLLKIANSALYGFRNEIDTVSRAVTVIGTTRLRDLVLTTSAINVFDGIPNELVTMEDFWTHSIYCGLIAKFLAEQAGVQQSESLFVAGLLHDIGQLVMFSRAPQQAHTVLLRSIDDDIEEELHLIEHAEFGFDHAELGGLLAEHWHLPVMLVETIRFHHVPEKAQHYKKETAIIHIANSLAVMAELHATHIEETDAAEIYESAWQQAGIAESAMLPAIEAAVQQIGEMRSMLMPATA